MKTSANNPNALAKALATALVLSVVGVLMLASRLTSRPAPLQSYQLRKVNDDEFLIAHELFA